MGKRICRSAKEGTRGNGRTQSKLNSEAFAGMVKHRNPFSRRPLILIILPKKAATQ